jgi:tRNA pseudouridine38-40 synthase
MPRYAFDCQFDGRAFQGTQVQSQARTLQGVLGTCLGEIAGQPVLPRPASRLDAGVSAEHLPVDAQLPVDWECRTLANALNARLPADVVVTRAARVADDWHAQHDAAGKTYRYEIARRATRPVLETRATWVRRLDRPDLLPGMAARLIGSQDLSGFACLRHDGSDEDDPVREVAAAAWSVSAAAEGESLVFRISGSGFLYKQIRGMVGAMLAVAQGRRSLALFEEAVAGGRRAPRLGNIAPAHGLVLERVAYAGDAEPAWERP